MSAAAAKMPPMPDLLSEQQRALLVANAIEDVRNTRRSGAPMAALRLDPEKLYAACWSFVVLDWSAQRVGESLGIVAAPAASGKGKPGARGRKKAASKAAAQCASRRDKTALKNLQTMLSVVRARYRAILAEAIARRGREMTNLTLVGDPTELLAASVAQLATNVSASLADPEKFAALGAMEQHAVIRGFENIAAGVKTLAETRLRTAQAEKIEAALAAVSDKLDRSPKGTMTRQDLAECFREAGFGGDISDSIRRRKEAAQ